MNIIGVHDGHNASSCFLKDSKIEIAIGEERLTRNKHQYGYPYKSINKIIDNQDLKSVDIDFVAMSTKTLPPRYFLTQRNSNFSVKDYWEEQKSYWYPLLYEDIKPSYTELFKRYLNDDLFPYDKDLIKNEDDHKGMWDARVKHICTQLNLSKDKILVYDHHKSHAAYGIYTSPLFRKKSLLVLTVDGGGDNTNATVSIVNDIGQVSEISRSSNCNIGRIYRAITLLLGMRPSDHEFKVMGLAAYNTEKHGYDSYKVFKDTLQVDGLGFTYKTKPKDHFFYFKDKLENQRFDSIAYGLQRRTEELLTEWIRNCVKETGIKDIVISGGVAQNIKANKKILEMDCVDSLYVPPGPGDESISIGAAFLGNAEKNKSIKSRSFSPYCGSKYSDKFIENFLKKDLPDNWEFKRTNFMEVADLLSKGEIIARFSSEGMEFGARALGNRSIIADPRRQDVIHYLNKLIKIRDFWMPFAPSILEDRVNDYLVVEKNNISKYMAIGHSSKKLAEVDLPAGLHPFDKTSRPQIVCEKDNPEYYNLIKSFESITGVGAVLNTSFNIHGEAIVESPEDAIFTLKNSGLKYLFIGNFLVLKK